MINSTYRTAYTSAAMPSTSTLTNSAVRTAPADGPAFVAAAANAGAWATWSASPQRGITA
ncbi:hypothetical protein MLAC_43850 [Mycobacterium lacus]|uniref:Uncharacterized protein n=1 Tax=Mycobacterium lacus TaxID=169765 RepID=A0A7I7NTG6_9MYCO|nr:hypothetical protein MLAC_43850 [Mycobacterium lacus]